MVKVPEVPKAPGNAAPMVEPFRTEARAHARDEACAEASVDARPFLRILLGPTASGKEQLALALAERLGGEIVSVDSMKIYRGLDIGTAKPSAARRGRVPHHALDFLPPTASCSVAEYVARAEGAIRRIVARGRVPILSGGTALYYKGLLEGIFPGPGEDPVERARWKAYARQHGPAALHARLAEVDSLAAAKLHPNDVRRVVRALEIRAITGRPLSERQTQWNGFHPEANATGLASDPANSPASGDAGGGQVVAPGEGGGAGQQAGRGSDPASTNGAPGAGRASRTGAALARTPLAEGPVYRYPCAMVALDRDRPVLHERIAARIEQMLAAGLEEEARWVYERRRSLSRTPLQAVAYKEWFPYFAGAATRAEAVERLRCNTRQLAKSQLTWFRKFPCTWIAADQPPAALADAILRAWESP